MQVSGGVNNLIKLHFMSSLSLSPTVDVCSPSMNAEIQCRLVDIIERHNAIIDLCSDLTGQFTVIVLMHFLSAAFVLCSTILDIMLVSRQRCLKVFPCFFGLVFALFFFYLLFFSLFVAVFYFSSFFFSGLFALGGNL